MDKFRVETIASTPEPQRVVWAAMHQDYSEDLVWDNRDRFPSETKAGELIVKHLLAGNRGHYGCYDEETEVLTADGWLKWSKVKSWHNLAAFDLNTREIKFEVPIALQKYHHQGEVYCLRGSQLDTAITLDHRMVVQKKGKDGSWTQPCFESAAEAIGKPRRYLQAGYLAESERHSWYNPWNIPPEKFALLVGLFVGSGIKPKSANQIEFSLTSSQLTDFFDALHVPFESKANQSYIINLPNIGKWFLDKCYDQNGAKSLPPGYLQLPVSEVAGLLTGLKVIPRGGHQPGETRGCVLNLFQHLECPVPGLRLLNRGKNARNWHYTSNNTHLLAQIQALVHLNNFSSNWSIAERASDRDRTGYYLNISEGDNLGVEVNSQNSDGYTESLKPYNGYVYCATVSTGALIVRRQRKVMVSGNCLEHPQITFNVGYFPHSMMQQIRTHRVGISFDVQSFRYTGQRVIDVVTGKRDLEDVFYLRPVGDYTNRQGKRYFYSDAQREQDLQWCLAACKLYAQRIEEGLSEEHARSIIPFDARQHFVISCNARSLMHLLDLRWKKDAQLEAQKFCELLYLRFEEWMPAVALWYRENRAKKARLSP